MKLTIKLMLSVENMIKHTLLLNQSQLKLEADEEMLDSLKKVRLKDFRQKG